MTKTIQREILIPQPPVEVWQAITDSATLAEWMFPNDFEPRVGHNFTFQVPPNPKVNFEGLVVHCEVLECEPPSRLAFSWTAGGLVDSGREVIASYPDLRPWGSPAAELPRGPDAGDRSPLRRQPGAPPHGDVVDSTAREL